jgi:hypothetical protein
MTAPSSGVGSEVRPSSTYVLIELPTPSAAPRPGLPAGTVGAVARTEVDLLCALCACYGEARSYRLERPVVRVGRAPDNDVVLTDASVSAAHAELWWNGAQWEVIDLHSRNGTVANGEPVTGRVSLSSGAHLLFGETYVVLHTEAVYQRTLEAAKASLARRF